MAIRTVNKYAHIFLLLAAYLGSAVGIFTSLYLTLHRTVFQEQVIESIPANAEKIFFSQHDFSKIKWIEKNREFEWHNNLYDVSKIEKTENGLEIVCVNDAKEKSMIGIWDQWKKNNLPHGKTKFNFQPQFCNQLYLVNTGSKEQSRTDFFFVKHFYNTPIQLTPSLPPKV